MDVGRNDWIDLHRAGLILYDEDEPYDGVIPRALHPRIPETDSTTEGKE